jgi:hypothetical protein
MMLISNTSLNISNRHRYVSITNTLNFKAHCVVVTAKYMTFAKYGRSKRFLSPYAMLPSVSNIELDIAKSKRPTDELIVAAY